MYVIDAQDRRRDYGEIRIDTLGEIETRVFFVAFTRREEAIRIISFRKANARETRRYREHLRARGESGKD
ncbi:MAG: BrnT family toxin [Rhizomicrobium sp.]